MKSLLLSSLVLLVLPCFGQQSIRGGSAMNGQSSTGGNPTYPAIPTLGTITATNAASPLTTPTYDGSGQLTHPDILYFSSGWHGHKYWMAATAYPASNVAFENPMILVSEDGSTWSVPVGLTNPISAQPGAANTYNSDTALLLDDDGLLYCIYRETQTNTYDKIYARSSADGITWSASTLLVTGAYAAMLSPVIRKIGGIYYMWVADASATGNSPATAMRRYTAFSLAGLGAALPELCIIAGGLGTAPWHLNVILVGTIWRGIFVKNGAGHLYYGESADGIHWVTPTLSTLDNGPTGAWDEATLYRSSILPTTGGYDLWYPAIGPGGIWHLGRTTIAVAP